MKNIGRIALFGGIAALNVWGQFTFTPERSNLGNLVILADNPTTLQRYNVQGFKINNIAQVPNGIAVTKVLGNYMVSTGSTLLQVTPTGTVTTVASAPSANGTAAFWVSLAPDGLGNVVLADNHQHAIWLVNPATSAITKVANYPVANAGVSDDVGVAVDPTGNYLVITDNSPAGVAMFSVAPTGAVTPVTLTGVAAKSTIARLLRYNGGYAFFSSLDNAVFTATFTAQPGTASPTATVAQLMASVSATTPQGFSVNASSGIFSLVTSAPARVAPSRH